MSDRDLLEEILHPSAILPLLQEYQRFKVELTETDCPDSKLTIRGCPGDCLVIDLDSSFTNEKLFNGSNGVSKRADYMLVSEQKKKIIFIEMKRTSSGRADIVKQLKGSLCVYNYCKSILSEFLASKDCFNDYSLRFVSFKHTTIPKRKSINKKMTKEHDTPNTMLEISHTQFSEFNKLAA